MSALVRLDHLVKRFGNHAAVDDVTLDVARGEVLALLGPSGSGKTTTLRLLAGFETPDTGRVLLEDRDITALTPVARRFGMVFQHYALFPHLTVGRNVAFGLESRGIHGADLAGRVKDALALVDLEGFEERRIQQLSGGQQQRVALARALAPEPVVLLLDEPLSNLDPSLRERTRREIRELIGRVGITTVLVTHEQEEAFDLGDRIAVLGEGRVEQVGTPDDLYNRPANAFVAGFIGRSSRLPVSVRGNDEGGVTVSLEDVQWRLPHARMPETSPAGRMLLLARPEAFRLVPPAPGVLRGTVADRRFTGSSALFTVRTGGGNVIEVQADPGEAEVGGEVGMQPGGNGLHLYPAAEDGD